MRRQGYPFAALCRMEKVKSAVMMALVNPNAGGLLVSGEKGSGKSTLGRAARELTDMPWVEVPVSVTEDRLFGSIDAEAAVRLGKRKLQPGLLDEADGGIMYIDDANLLREDILSSVLGVREAGGYRLERDGLSEQCDTKYTVLAVMTPESGTLGASALDRFGMFVSIDDEPDEEARMEIMQRVLSYEKNGEAFRREWLEETGKLKKQIADARALLPEVEASDAMIRLAAVYTLKANVAGHRADIYMIEAARAIAALAGRTYILPKDLERAAEFVLPHRMRPEPPQAEEPQQQTQQEPQQQEQQPQKEPPPPQEMFEQPPTPENDKIDTEEHEGNNEQDKDEREHMENPNAGNDERVDAADLNVVLPPVWIEPVKGREKKKGSGKRSATRTDERQGRYVRAALPRKKVTDVAFDATLRAAAPFQKWRKKTDCALVIEKEDIRTKIREKRTGNIFLFVVDASGSMGARERMKTVKGVILKILLEAYQKRDRVGMIAFRKKQAEVLLPVTKSVDFAQKKLASMPTGGKTPLAKGIEKTADLLDMMYRQDPAQDPVVIFITDGRATASLNEGGDPVEEAMHEASRVAKHNLPIAVIDTENGFIKLGLAKKLAKKLEASYFHMDKLSEDSLLHIWRKMS
ncbi:VWA domain-containing protein [Schwartzia succinivorans]|jgi:magnesium chelatase subunit D|uniref:Magnesium chelatase subunit D n=1 Tax=Schwartzia succinivorans DSM 10502 TaxID=1123243 RepID=A0A1M4Z1I0_9FIRM|nr:VWA domain-containing protein [Schwartzia succinivorans]SHF11582.1 magnesium chelatase subunit D [Schwartzia succinivorans DSM 10502]